MPTKTFFNLPEGKREKIMEAIRAEFYRTSFEEVSINRIIHAADIPRGSFYQYFRDKQDMTLYLLSDYRRIIFNCACLSLEKNNGDLFSMFIDIYDFTYSFVMKGNNSFFKNLFSDIRINIDFYTLQTEGNTFEKFIKKTAPHVNTEMLDIQNEADFENIFGIHLTIMGEALARTFYDVENHTNARNNYIARLELLKRGFIKNKGI